MVIVTGEKDFITDGEHQQWVTGGNSQMTEVTGTGCLLSAICCASYLAGNKPFDQLIETLSLYKKWQNKPLLIPNTLAIFKLQY